MATLTINNNYELVAQGLTSSGKQGLAASTLETPYDITVTGTEHKVIGSLATATVRTVYDDDDDAPADFDYLYFWADQICYIQIIGSGSNVIIKLAACQPFVLPGYNLILAAANTTIITGGSEPTGTDIDSIVIGNYSGNTMNFVFAVID